MRFKSEKYLNNRILPIGIMVNVTKIIKAKIVCLTKRKEKLLNDEFENLQKYLHNQDNVKLYSANKQQAKRAYKKIKPNKIYPLRIRKDLLKLKKNNTSIAKYWARIPVAGKRGGMWVAIKPHEEILPEYEIGESIIFKKKNDWYLYITISKKVEINENHTHILSIDIGERVMATICGSWNSLKPIFYGREIRGIRRHYNWLRQKLQKKKLMNKVKKIGGKENRIIADLMHKISRQIVNLAKQNNAVIVMGKLTGLRKNAKNKGKLVNKIINSWGYYKFQKMIEYKSMWEGIKVVYIDERYTSKTCHRCGKVGKRKTQGSFNCSNCGLKDFNADLNGARNIFKRFSAYMVENGAAVNQPLTSPLSGEATVL